jgi:hypothetical protein
MLAALVRMRFSPSLHFSDTSIPLYGQVHTGKCTRTGQGRLADMLCCRLEMASLSPVSRARPSCSCSVMPVDHEWTAGWVSGAFTHARWLNDSNAGSVRRSRGWLQGWVDLLGSTHSSLAKLRSCTRNVLVLRCCGHPRGQVQIPAVRNSFRLCAQAKLGFSRGPVIRA